MKGMGGLLPPCSGRVDPVNVEGMFTIAQSFDVNHGKNFVSAVEFAAQRRDGNSVLN